MNEKQVQVDLKFQDEESGKLFAGKKKRGEKVEMPFSGEKKKKQRLILLGKTVRERKCPTVSKTADEDEK